MAGSENPIVDPLLRCNTKTLYFFRMVIKDYPQKSNVYGIWSQLKVVSVISKNQHSQESHLRVQRKISSFTATLLKWYNIIIFNF